MGDIILIIGKSILALSECIAIFMAVYYSVIDDIATATYYIAMLCLFLLIDSRCDK